MIFPAIKYTRESHKSTTRYFGPYTDSRAARNLVDIVRRIVPICSSSCSEWRRLCRKLEQSSYDDIELDERPCFDCHVGLGPGACCGGISPEVYQQQVRKVERFLSGSHKEFIDELKSEMAQAAQDLDFERAGRIKSRIDTIESLAQTQHAVSSHRLNADVIGVFREETIAGIAVLMLREGRIMNTNEFIFNKGKDVPASELLRMFVLRYYGSTESIPHELIVEEVPEDDDVICEWLTEKLASANGANGIFYPSPREAKKRTYADGFEECPSCPYAV